jgi:hypothetical protein
LKWLDFKGGRIHTIALDYNYLNSIVVIIEHPDLPEVHEAEMLQDVTPAYIVAQYGERFDPPKLNLLRRSVFGRLARFPNMLLTHYRILRKSNGKLSSFRASWGLSKVIFKK